MESDKKTVYEVGFHIVTTLPEEKVPAETTKIKDVLEKAGVEFISEDFPKRIQLAYAIEKKTQSGTIKHNDAYFGWVKFETEPSIIEGIKKGLDANENILRYLIVKTVKENTMPVKTFNSQKETEGEDTDSKKEEAPKEEVTKEDEKKIDESIEDLVIE